ncbi:MAG TPA: DedA family protein [Candidatus Omnitrophota bacterium]|nr:DedA family protein [Candidatus Omnitrophota bacterium]HPS19361.1 DedA family protein [Candidatus Omnitrophota bacterium]
MELISQLVDIVIHFDKHLSVIIQNLGNWSYLMLFVIIFCETGLVVTPFLPGDSLLFVVGAFAALGSFDIFWLCAVLAFAAIAGDSVNYAIGKIFGEKLFRNERSKIFKKEYLVETHNFYEKYGGKTIILARFIPIIRTFAPFVAGIGKMSYLKFFAYNVCGGILWITAFVCGGFFFGNTPVVKKHFHLVVLAIIVISVLPAVIEYWKHTRSKKS